MLAVNKADGERVALARAAAAPWRACATCRPASTGRRDLTVSAHTGDGIDERGTIDEYIRVLEEAGAFEAQRNAQAERWMWSLGRSG